ncbi:uncharacterized protein LOC115210307 [Octopus sinensis]|uniref:Uncharacterized protein LOC115210307 n=1 Tax=Octopus sinensis TaxID=2607531 RepID=A0A6P7S9E5_9MOLL|nr:uncharacterized protein LOC115210307 [Octopus sinensis]XP_029634691.1 uncharacterized protein LOC115210307 [Octopus sinensis]XP_036357827.1 uncharacterized protein LOC115210307 [Octopus sinensis]XP_036357828.1 uncharacterized protein LOC115210307 [Octopus sinensis]
MAGALTTETVAPQARNKPKKNSSNSSGPVTHPLNSYPDIVSGETSVQSLVAGRHRPTRNVARVDGQRQPASDVISSSNGLSVYPPFRDSHQAAASAAPNNIGASGAQFGGLQLSTSGGGNGAAAAAAAAAGNIADGRSNPADDPGHQNNREESVHLLGNGRLPPFPQEDDVDLVPSNWSPHDEPMLGRAQPIRTRDLHAGVYGGENVNTNEILPDILNSHMVGRPVAISRPNLHRNRNDRQVRTRNGDRSAQRQRNPVNQPSRPAARTRSRNNSSQQTDRNCKAPCLKCLTAITSFKYVLILLSMLGICCVIIGIVLAALHGSGSSFLFLAIMFFGLGLLLLIVVIVGWKFTPQGHEPLHLLFGLGDHSLLNQARSHGMQRTREGYWHGGIMYPEFQYRRPPPSYDVSMQEYQQQLLQQYQQSINNTDNYSLPSSPPPTYRSRASTLRPGVYMVFPPNPNESYPNSLPPTYRSQMSDAHSRPSLPLTECDSESFAIADLSDFQNDPISNDTLESNTNSINTDSNFSTMNHFRPYPVDHHTPAYRPEIGNLTIDTTPSMYPGRSQGTMTDPEGLTPCSTTLPASYRTDVPCDILTNTPSSPPPLPAPPAADALSRPELLSERTFGASIADYCENSGVAISNPISRNSTTEHVDALPNSATPSSSSSSSPSSTQIKATAETCL